MTKFKVDDKVRLVSMPAFGFKIGDVHTVSRVIGDGYFSTKEYDDKGQHPRPFHEKYWELVEPTYFPLYSEEAAVKLLTERGYEVKAPPEPLKGKVVIYRSAEGQTWAALKERWDQWNFHCKKGYTIIAIIDWTEGQGI